MSKVIKNCHIEMIKSIHIQVMVDKDMTDDRLKKDLIAHFESYADGWIMDETINVYQGKKQSLQEYKKYLDSHKQKFEVVCFNDDSDSESLSDMCESDFAKLLEQEQLEEREARDNAAQIKMEI